jgi:hypothetical protein
MEEVKTKKSKIPFFNKSWAKSLGMGAFLFFFIKGLIWLAVFFGAFKIFS